MLPTIGRPDTRSQVGTVFRWSEGWAAAVENAEGLGWDVRRKDREAVRIRVEFLRNFFFPPRAERLALDDARNSSEGDHRAALADI